LYLIFYLKPYIAYDPEKPSTERVLISFVVAHSRLFLFYRTLLYNRDN